MFKKRRGIRIPYEKQGLIYFNCVNYKDMPEDIQNKILANKNQQETVKNI